MFKSVSEPASGTSVRLRKFHPSKVPMTEIQRKAEEFLQGQQLYYRSLKAHRDELKRFKESRDEHKAAVQLLSDLPDKVTNHLGAHGPPFCAEGCRWCFSRAPSLLHDGNCVQFGRRVAGCSTE